MRGVALCGVVAAFLLTFSILGSYSFAFADPNLTSPKTTKILNIDTSTAADNSLSSSAILIIAVVMVVILVLLILIFRGGGKNIGYDDYGGYNGYVNYPMEDPYFNEGAIMPYEYDHQDVGMFEEGIYEQDGMYEEEFVDEEFEEESEQEEINLVFGQPIATTYGRYAMSVAPCPICGHLVRGDQSICSSCNSIIA
jgi:hypothetical protein